MGIQALQVESAHEGAMTTERDSMIAVVQLAEHAGQLLEISLGLGHELQVEGHPPRLDLPGVAVGLRVNPAPRCHELVAGGAQIANKLPLVGVVRSVHDDALLADSSFHLRFPPRGA